MKSETLRRASEIWDYMSDGRSNKKSDAIIICCSYDLRVCDHACELIKKGQADTLVISGKSGNWTKHLWDVPEAEIFYERALENNIDQSQIIKELRATNFGENVAYSRDLLPNVKTATFVSKPNSLLRVQLTAEAQWSELAAFTSCPELKFPEQVSNVIGVWGVINEMVGDIERILMYPKLGYQTEHQFPQRIIEHWRYLVREGFTSHLIDANSTRECSSVI